MQRIVIQTQYGEIQADLYEEEAPNTVAFFLKLVAEGFYDGLEFFKVIASTLVQTGCPNNDGTGNAGTFIKCELSTQKKLMHDYGTLSMAHTGRDMNSSQFFICLQRRNVDHLDGNHTCFGKVVEGSEWLNNIRQGDVVESIRQVQRRKV